MTVLVVDDPRYEEHRSQRYHPERPERLGAARRGLDAGLPEAHREPVAARPATTEELLRVHAPGYIERLEARLDGGYGQLDPDTYYGPGTRTAAWLAAGASVDLARALRERRADHGVALLRPPGHHARPDGAMGFCLLNNIAIAAADLVATGRCSRVAIVDWDVHHGNGTQDAFEADPRVLYLSVHQWPFYPGTGRPEEIGTGDGTGFNVNVALPAGSGRAIYGEAFRRVVLPVLESYDAEVVLVSMGFDGHADDPLAGMELDVPSYAAMATALLAHARDGDRPIGFVLEGGYDLQVIESSMAAVARAIEGEQPPLPEGEPTRTERQSVERTLELLRPHWSL